MKKLTYTHPDGRTARIWSPAVTSHLSLLEQGFTPPENADFPSQLLDVGLSHHIIDQLANIGIYTLNQLRQADDALLLTIYGLGSKTLAEIREKLEADSE